MAASVFLTAVKTIVALAAVAVLIELWMRYRFRRTEYYVWPRRYRRIIALDAATFPQLEPVVRFDVNDDGERAETCPPGPNVYRVLILGGSTVEASLNDQDTSWPVQVEARLNAPEARAALGVRHVHIGNIGRSGMDAHGVSLVLERTARRYPELSAIWMMVGPGDLMRWLEAGAPPDAVVPPLDVNRCFAENPEVRFGLHPKRLAIASVAKRLRLRWLRPIERRQNAGGWIAGARALRRDAERFVTEVPEMTNFLEKFEAELDVVVCRAVAIASQVILIRQPAFRKARYLPEEEALFWNGGIGNAYRGEKVTVFFSTEVILELLDRIEERIARVAARNGALYVDTLPGMTASVATFYDHFHLTRSGAEQLAAVVSDAVIRTRGRSSGHAG